MTDEKLDRLFEVMIEFKKEFSDFKKEFYEFKDEMYLFKSEMYSFRDEAYKRFDGDLLAMRQWGNEKEINRIKKTMGL
ncbi:hypothetical protein [Bacillus sp. FSL K6-3431]|uniref:hypothetical protein n=1 Tax=Bacillus sp. FSL K6-3431 TaxID=2921500 RepID=UPI0030FCCFB0